MKEELEKLRQEKELWEKRFNTMFNYLLDERKKADFNDCCYATLDHVLNMAAYLRTYQGPLLEDASQPREDA